MGTYHFIEFNAARRGAALGLRVSAGSGTGPLFPLYVIHDLPNNKTK
jgi:hypothetical protein